MSEKIIERIREEVAELDKYVIINEKNIKKLKKEYERAVNINERFTDRIKAMKKEMFDLERGMYGILEVHERRTSFDDEEFAINATYTVSTKREN